MGNSTDNTPCLTNIISSTISLKIEFTIENIFLSNFNEIFHYLLKLFITYFYCYINHAISINYCYFLFNKIS